MNVIIDKITNLCSGWTLWSWIARLAIFSLSVYMSHKVKVKSGLIWYKDNRWDDSLKVRMSAKLKKVLITLPASQAIPAPPKRQICDYSNDIQLKEALPQKYTVSFTIKWRMKTANWLWIAHTSIPSRPGKPWKEKKKNIPSHWQLSLFSNKRNLLATRWQCSAKTNPTGNNAKTHVIICGWLWGRFSCLWHKK